MIESDSEEEEEEESDEKKVMQNSPTFPSLPSTSKVTYNMDTDISLLEAPTFTTIDRGPSQPMVDLTWDHEVDLMGKKVRQNNINQSEFKHLYLFKQPIKIQSVFLCSQSK